MQKRYGVVVLIVCHIAVALPLAWHLNIWSAEGASLYCTESLGFAFRNAASLQHEPPLYLLLLSLWRIVNGSIFFARLFSIIVCAAAIWLFADTLRYVLKSRHAMMLATAFFAFHPIMIWPSTEIRPHALVILLSALLIRLLVVNFHKASGQVRWQIVVLAITIAAVAIVGSSPLFFSDAFRFSETSISTVRHVSTDMLNVILPTDMRSSVESSVVAWVRSLIVLALFVITTVIAIIRRRKVSKYTIAFAGVSATIGAGLVITDRFAGGGEELCYLSLMFVPLVLFLASFIRDVYGSDGCSEVWKYAATLGGVVVVWFFWYAVGGIYPNWTKTGDWTRVATYIQQNEKAGQAIVVFNTYDMLAMRYEYHGVNRIMPDERFFDFGSRSSTPEQIKQRTEFTISEFPNDAPEIWLITNDECRRPGTCRDLEKYLNDNFDVAGQRPFYGNSVTLLRRRPFSADLP